MSRVFFSCYLYVTFLGFWVCRDSGKLFILLVELTGIEPVTS
jgi:hypothetical protein